jgi:hypothetical protein
MLKEGGYLHGDAVVRLNGKEVVPTVSLEHITTSRDGKRELELVFSRE